MVMLNLCLPDRVLEEKGEIESKYAELEKKWRPFQVSNGDIHIDSTCRTEVIHLCLLIQLFFPGEQEQIDGLEDINKLLLSQTSLAQSEVEKETEKTKRERGGREGA